jgi:hypothetical protein
MAFFEQPNAFRITIDAENMMANGCQATASDQAHVTAAYYANLQESHSGEAPHCMTIPLVLLVGTRVEDAFEFRPFGVLERPFAPKKHWFAARRSIPAGNLRKIEVYPKIGLLCWCPQCNRKSGKEL